MTRPRGPQRGLALLAKRVLDCGISAGVLCASAPVLGAAAVAVRVSMGAPVLFTQERPGLGARPFRIYKLRTMRRARPGDRDEDRLTPLGRWLRKTSIDELPQLVNVLRGDMSLVGPRPLLMQYVKRYSPQQARRLDVLPGITGWAQVNGRNAISWPEKLALDTWYVDHWSFGLDVRILAKTVRTVLKREGISAANEATMPEFMGETHEVG